MPQILRHQLWIALAAGVVVFTNLGVPRLWDEDEPKNATCAREMRARGDLIVPTFNGTLRTDKPVLLYWLMIGAYNVFGENEFAARFWSAAFAVGTSLLTYHLGRILFRPAVGLWAGLALCTSVMFDADGRWATPDLTLIFFATLSLLAFVIGTRDSWNTTASNGAAGGEPASDLASLVPRRWPSFVLMYAAMGMAVLAKGPVGVLLPCGLIGLYLICVSSRRWTTPLQQAWLQTNHIPPWARAFQHFIGNFLPAARAMRLWIALLVVAAIALPWYIAVGVKTDGAWLAGFFGKHNLSRFAHPMEGHRGPIFYYLPAILAGFFPWSICLPLSVVGLIRRIKDDPARRSCVFLLCWVGLYVGLFSLAGTKLPSYVLPAYPALALIVGLFIDAWVTQPATVPRNWMRLGFGTWALVGVALLLAPAAIRGILPGEAIVGLVGLVAIVGSGMAAWFFERSLAMRSAITMVVTAVVMATTMFGFATVRISRHQNSQPLIAKAQSASTGLPQMASFDYNAPSLVFYAQSHVDYYSQPEQVRAFFATADDRFLIVPARHLEEIQKMLPAEVTILERQPRFLSKHREEDLVLLGRPLQTARTAPQNRF